MVQKAPYNQNGPKRPTLTQYSPNGPNSPNKKVANTDYIPHICHMYHIWDVRKKKIGLWRNSRFLYAWQMWGNLRNLHMRRNFEISPHDQCGEVSNFSTSGICVMWRMSPQMYNLCCFVQKSVLSQFTLFCHEIHFVSIYALLFGENFDCKLRMWRK